MFTNCYNSGPFNFAFFVCDIKANFAKAVGFWEFVPPVIVLFKRSVPIVIKLWAIVSGLVMIKSFIMLSNSVDVGLVIVAALVTICH